MKNVAMKAESYRIAEAQAVLSAPPHCIELLRQGNTEKGDALKTARIAGILAAKRTDELIPLCHPLPIYRADVEFELHEAAVTIMATVETIGPTGVEMEARGNWSTYSLLSFAESIRNSSLWLRNPLQEAITR